MHDPFALTPLLQRMIHFEQIAADFNRLNGDALGELEQLQTLLSEIRPLLQESGTFRARAAETRRRLEEEEERISKRGLGRVLSVAQADMETRDRTFSSRAAAPEMRPWEDIKVSVKRNGSC